MHVLCCFSILKQNPFLCNVYLLFFPLCTRFENLDFENETNVVSLATWLQTSQSSIFVTTKEEPGYLPMSPERLSGKDGMLSVGFWPRCLISLILWYLNARIFDY